MGLYVICKTVRAELGSGSGITIACSCFLSATILLVESKDCFKGVVLAELVLTEGSGLQLLVAYLQYWLRSLSAVGFM